MALLAHNTLLKLIQAILNSGIDSLTERNNFFISINRDFFNGFERLHIPKGQLMYDIGRLNGVERLADGQVPLLIYLQNLAIFLSGLEEEKLIREQIDFLIRKTSGTPKVDPLRIPEINEKIIHKDDTVTYQFMRAGLQTAASVMKLKVPSFEQQRERVQANGTPIIFLGTGWLIAETLIITNHHVINARMDNERNAVVEDLKLQAKGTVAIFDFDAEGMEGIVLQAIELVAWNEDLDYAILRIPPTNRGAISCVKERLEMFNDTIAVNIIQHPEGRSKRYGIRNNLVSASTEIDLRYFTDTESGSSGSPVLNDKWQVVALHRAAIFVSGTQFQGKDTAYVNIGTHISLILQDIKTRFPLIGNEIG